MKRDMTLVREILMAIEADTTSPGFIKVKVEGHSQEEVSYHVQLLAEAKLVDATDASTMSGAAWIPTRLTWAGHEFLDAVRNETVWKKVKQLVADKGGAVPFEVLKSVAIRAAGALFE